MNPTKIAGIAALACVLAACDRQIDASRAVEQAVASEILAPAIDPDLVLANKVAKALGVDSVTHPYGVAVTVTDGTVKLWGTVDSDTSRKRFEVLAAGVVGVRAVENRLRVDPGA